MSDKELWYEARDKKGRLLGIIHAKNAEDAMGKARHIYGLAVIEVERVEEII